MVSSSLCVLRVACLLLLPGVSSAASLDRPLPVEVLAGEQLLASSCGLSLSPDGKFVAYAVQDGRKQQATSSGETDFEPRGTPLLAEHCDISVTEIQTGDRTNVTEGNGSNWAPSWSPDGTQIVFYSDRDGAARLWAWDRASHVQRRCSDVVVRPWEPVQWTPDGKTIVARIMPEEAPPGKPPATLANKQPRDATVEGVLVYQSDDGTHTAGRSYARTPAWSFDDFMGDLATVDLATGRARRITRDKRVGEFRLAPDGEEIVYSAFKGFEAEGKQTRLYDLVSCSSAGASCKQLLTDVRLPYFLGGAFRWSPDGRLLTYVANGELAVVGRNGSVRHYGAALDGEVGPQPLWDGSGRSIYLTGPRTLRRVDLAHGRITDLDTACANTSAEHPPVPEYRLVGLLTNSDGNEFASPDGGKTVIARVDDASTHKLTVVTLALATGCSTTLFEEKQAPTSELLVARDGQRIVYAAETASRPSELWTAQVRGSSPQAITDLNPEFRRYAAGAGEIVEWRSLRGGKQRGALLLPGDYRVGRRYPLVICVSPAKRVVSPLVWSRSPGPAARGRLASLSRLRPSSFRSTGRVSSGLASLPCASRRW